MILWRSFTSSGRKGIWRRFELRCLQGGRLIVWCFGVAKAFVVLHLNIGVFEIQDTGIGAPIIKRLATRGKARLGLHLNRNGFIIQIEIIKNFRSAVGLAVGRVISTSTKLLISVR